MSVEEFISEQEAKWQRYMDEAAAEEKKRQMEREAEERKDIERRLEKARLLIPEDVQHYLSYDAEYKCVLFRLPNHAPIIVGGRLGYHVMHYEHLWSDKMSRYQVVLSSTNMNVTGELFRAVKMAKDNYAALPQVIEQCEQANAEWQKKQEEKERQVRLFVEANKTKPAPEPVAVSVEPDTDIDLLSLEIYVEDAMRSIDKGNPAEAQVFATIALVSAIQDLTSLYEEEHGL